MSSTPEDTDGRIDADSNDDEDLVGMAGLGVLGAGRDDDERERTAERLERATATTNGQQHQRGPASTPAPDRNGHDAGHSSTGGLTRRGTLAALGGLGVLGLGSQSASAVEAHDHLGENWNGNPSSNYGLRVEATSDTRFGLMGFSNENKGRGVYGRAYSTTGTTRGLSGRVDSQTDGAAALAGRAAASSGRTYGFVGRSDSTEGVGAFALAPASSGSTLGIEGRSASDSGTGVLGNATASSGTTYGVKGTTASSAGYGLYTPDDSKVDGKMATTGTWQVDVDGDTGVELTSSGTFTDNNTTFEASGSSVVGHLNQVKSGVLSGSIGGGGLYDQDNDTMLPNTVTDHFNTIGGGYDNTAGDSDSDLLSAYAATVGGGRFNTASARGTTVGGGNSNEASGTNATVGGGISNTASAETATVGGGNGNAATDYIATVAGGNSNEASGSYAAVGGGYDNVASDSYATVAGGGFNTAGVFGSTIAGGDSNDVYDEYGSVGGGQSNQAGTDDGDATTAQYATVGGGDTNTASASSTTVGGGSSNSASTQYATVAGGSNNSASGQSAAVGGGVSNSAQSVNSTVAGGFQNTASGDNATVAGGSDNVASGNYSFAAGRAADAANAGSFVWSDSGSTTFSSTGTDQFLVDAAGGVGIGTDSPAATLDVSGDSYLNGNATIISNLDVNGGATVQGDVTATSNVTVSNSATVNGDLAVDSVKTATSGATLGISGDVQTGGAHTVTGSLTVSNDASVGGDLDVSGTIRRDAMTQVYLGSLFTVPSGSETIVTFDSESVDEPGAWDVASNVYTCPLAGHYEITYNPKFVTSFSSDTVVIPKVRVNGANAYNWHGKAFNDELYERSFKTTLTNLTSGDAIDFTIRQDSGSSKDMPYGQGGTRVSIRYLGDGTA